MLKHSIAHSIGLSSRFSSVTRPSTRALSRQLKRCFVRLLPNAGSPVGTCELLIGIVALKQMQAQIDCDINPARSRSENYDVSIRVSASEYQYQLENPAMPAPQKAQCQAPQKPHCQPLSKSPVPAHVVGSRPTSANLYHLKLKVGEGGLWPCHVRPRCIGLRGLCCR